MKTISSRYNPSYRIWKSLGQSKGIKKYGQFIVSGEKLIKEYLSQYFDSVSAVLFCQDHMDSSIAKEFKTGKEFVLEPKLFDEIDVLGTHSPILIAIAVTIPDFSPHSDIEGLEIVTPTGDPSNLGGLLRSASAFGANRVILSSEACTPYHPKCIRALATPIFSLNLETGPHLSSSEYQNKSTVTLDLNGTSIRDFKWQKNVRIILGEEGPGLPTDFKSDAKITIPTSGRTESLNQVVAASIAMNSYFQSQI